MAGSLNKVILIGRLGQDPDVREVGSAKVANFSIATDESYTDRSGNKVEKTEWHRIVMWNRAAENAEKYLKKGSLIYVEGKLETRSWENESGEKRYSTEVKSFSFQMLDNKNDQNSTYQPTLSSSEDHTTSSQQNTPSVNPNITSESVEKITDNTNKSVNTSKNEDDVSETDDLPF